jgi:hypothetical protein
MATGMSRPWRSFDMNGAIGVSQYLSIKWRPNHCPCVGLLQGWGACCERYSMSGPGGPTLKPKDRSGAA